MMAKIYKIHPAIGIARVGQSTDGYFLAPETPDGAMLALSDGGDEIAFAGYKDGAHLMRRQGVRFRIFEYDDNGGQHTFAREITADEATIAWSVTLASRKAAGLMMATNQFDEDGAQIVTPGTGFRNNPPAGMTRADLVASIDLTATGKKFRQNPPAKAKFLGQPFYIGEARTDASGRLVVLGGHGEANTWTGAALVNFLNNPGWHDDIADGPVDAKITLGGVTHQATGAWVAVAPPDFAPDITALTTLYDVAVQARFGLQVGTVSYPMDIAPMFQRAAAYHWVNSAGDVLWDAMREFLAEPSKLEDNSKSAAAVQHRDSVRDTMLEAEGLLESFRMTPRQKKLLDLWVDGDFIPGPDPARPPLDAGQQLDRVSLEHCVGGGFFPGIEAGLLLRTPSIYSELGRLTRGQFTDFGGVITAPQPGFLTERMAVPWQADFMQCLVAWWPAQRPDVARFTENGAATPAGLQWDRKVRLGGAGSPANRKNMVEHFSQLGVIERMTVAGSEVFGEKGRDPGLDTGT
jgi:hypothetical protein